MIEQHMPEEAKEALKQEKTRKREQATLDAKIGETELAQAICRVYNLGSRFVFHDETRFEPADCKEEAEGLLALINRFPQARVLLRLIAPLGALAAMIEKIEYLVSRQRERNSNVQPETSSHIQA